MRASGTVFLTVCLAIAIGLCAPAAAKSKAPSKEEILHDAAALVQSIHLSCEVADAALYNDGNAILNGNTVHVRTFETACKNGLGYFLIEQAPEPVGGFSCFAAESMRQDDIAQKRAPAPACSLSANSDTKAMAQAVLGGLGKSCTVKSLRSMGQQSASQSELTEAACTDGSGYVIFSALPGATQSVTAQSCLEAYKHGIACTLSATGAITAETFKAALVQHNVACTVQALHLMGKEGVKQRHVVEFKCAEHPEGLVAFIPLESAAAPFETADCATAGSKYHLICTLNQFP